MYQSSADFNGRFRLKGKSLRSPISSRLQNLCFFKLRFGRVGGHGLAAPPPPWVRHYFIHDLTYIHNSIKLVNSSQTQLWFLLVYFNTFAASYLNTQGLNNSCLKSPASTLVDLTFQSHTLRSFSLNQLRNLSL